jgi:tyrosine-specific transport protein
MIRLCIGRNEGCSDVVAMIKMMLMMMFILFKDLTAATALNAAVTSPRILFHSPPDFFFLDPSRQHQQQQHSQQIRHGRRRDSSSSLFLDHDDENAQPCPASPSTSAMTKGQPIAGSGEDGSSYTDNRRRIGNAALLIAGTTVGGGFLALPSVVAPTGFLPSASALIGIWAYFWYQSMIVVECIIDTAMTRTTSTTTTRGLQDEDKPPPRNEDHPGIAATAKSTFGRRGEAVAVLLLVILTQATLVSQISRAGSLLFPPRYYAVGCAITACSVAALVFGNGGSPGGVPSVPSTVLSPPWTNETTSAATVTTATTVTLTMTATSRTTSINSFLTLVFVTMAVTLFVTGAPVVQDWSQLFAAAPPCIWTQTLPRAIPTLLQLLVYGEILPTVCQLLHYQVGPIRWAITWGSLVPLFLEVGWAALGLGLVPPSSITASGSSSSIGAMVVDPVNVLLTAKAGYPVRWPLWTLAVTAITTTMIGSYLALQSTWNDLFPQSSSSSSSFSSLSSSQPELPQRTAPSSTSTFSRAIQWLSDQRRELVSASVIVLPSLAIASISPDLFLGAIDFAGSYPVLLLWGLAPPLVAWKQRRRRPTSTTTTSTTPLRVRVQARNKRQAHRTLPPWALLASAGLSLSLLGMSAIPDVIHVGNTIGCSVRGIFLGISGC